MNTKNKYYIYIHKFKNNTLYIGKGTKYRAFKIQGRNKYYNHLLSKYGKPKIKIIKNNLTEEESFEYEKHFIYLAKNKNKSMCNLTDGGEGVSGLKHTEEVKAKMSINTSFRNPEVRAKIKESRKGKSSHMKGKKHTDETKKIISESRKGKLTGDKHHFFGKKGALSVNYGKLKDRIVYKFYHKDFGVVYSTKYDLCKKYNLADNKVYAVVDGKIKHYKGWIYMYSSYIRKKKAEMSIETRNKIRKSKTGKESTKKDLTKYKFMNKKTKEIKECTKFELRDEFKFAIENINSIVNSKSQRVLVGDWFEISKYDMVFSKCVICGNETYNNKLCSSECKRINTNNKARLRNNSLITS